MTGSVPESCKLHFIVGIDLPSDLSVFRRLYATPADKAECLIYTGSQTFHPKVYIIENERGGLLAFVGSANTTAGGLINNIEYSIKVQDEVECRIIFDWFQELKTNSGKLTAAFLEQYAQASGNMAKRESSNKADAASLKESLRPKKKHTPLVVSAGQFFLAAHYDAYHPGYEEDYSPAADQRRYAVKQKLKELHNSIYPRFAEFGLTELHAHGHTASRISHHQYRKGFNNHLLRSMWLHYGYSKADYAGSYFGNHPRLQVILHYQDIGIWLVVGRDFGSRQERDNLKQRIECEPAFNELLFKTVKDIGGIYTIDIHPHDEPIDRLATPDELKDLILSDAPHKYFIIGRTFQPDDAAISAATIAETVLNEFRRLYPVYLILKP